MRLKSTCTLEEPADSQPQDSQAPENSQHFEEDSQAPEDSQHFEEHSQAPEASQHSEEEKIDGSQDSEDSDSEKTLHLDDFKDEETENDKGLDTRKPQPLKLRRRGSSLVARSAKPAANAVKSFKTDLEEFQKNEKKVMKALYEKKYNRDEKEALPKSLLLGMYFQGDETKFTKALDQGEIELVREENGAFCEFPDGTGISATTFENCMGDVAQSVDQLNTKVEEFKGYVKAKK
eukprot:s1756_g3.t1